MTNAERQKKWRESHLELSRQRNRENMRKKRKAERDLYMAEEAKKREIERTNENRTESKVFL